MDKDSQNYADAGAGLKGSQEAIPFKRLFPKRSFLNSSKITKKKIINLINFLHLSSLKTGKESLFRVLPGPCIGDEITCMIPEGAQLRMDEYEFRGFVVDNGKSVILMDADPVRTLPDSITMKLGGKGTIFNLRSSKRFSCNTVDAVLRQGDKMIEGSMDEFNPSGFRISLKDGSAKDPWFLNPSKDLTVELIKNDKKIFSSKGNLIRADKEKNILIVKPFNDPQKLHRQKKYRNPRTTFSPSPKAVFHHPLTSKKITFDIVDITTAGFSIVADADTSFLMPGMIIDDVTITRSGLFNIKLAAQVVYERKHKKKKKYGLAICDMDVVTYNQLYDMYCNALDKHANFSRDIDMVQLWEFFFNSGFIYPQKYSCVSRQKEDYKRTYERLYHDSPEIFASFTYRENDKIYGHVSIIKAYDRTWMIHHLAAIPMEKKRTGLFVLNHVLNYFDGFHRMPSIGMDYMIFYFRPDNRFPDHFFGGFCRELKDKEKCSMDCFAYMSCTLPSRAEQLLDGWCVSECSGDDISDLKSGYKALSGGLAVDSFCLDTKGTPEISVERDYEKCSLRRRYNAYVLKYRGKAKAYMIVDESNAGVNLSELLNSIKIIVTDGKDLPWSILHASLARFSDTYGIPTVPVLIYPFQYADEQKIQYGKKYNLWVLSKKGSYDYSEHLKEQAKIRPVKLLLKVILSGLFKK